MVISSIKYNSKYLYFNLALTVSSSMALVSPIYYCLITADLFNSSELQFSHLSKDYNEDFTGLLKGKAPSHVPDTL